MIAKKEIEPKSSTMLANTYIHGYHHKAEDFFSNSSSLENT